MKSLLLVPSLGALLLTVRALASEAIPSYTVDGANGGYVPGGAGFVFSPQTNLAITALGFNGTGLNSGPYVISLWANGRQLASTIVSLNSPLLNQTHYEVIPAVQLVSGQTYSIRAAGTNNYWVGNLIQTFFGAQRFSVAPDIFYQGSAYGTNSAGEFPSGTGDFGSYYVAPNFQYRIGSGTNLVWAATVSNQWDIATSMNWVNLGNNFPDRFYGGENVLFDDRVGVVTNITIPAGIAVVPTVMTNNSSVNQFTIGGAGRISGAAVIVKQGSSTLTLNSTNDYSGDVMVLAGTLKLGCPGALGATNGPTIVTNAATLDLNGIDPGFEPMVVAGTGVGGRGAIVNDGTQPTVVQRLTLTGHTTLGGSNRWDLGSGSSAFLLTDGQPWGITKVSTNQFSLVGVTLIDPALGDIDVQQGTFSLQTTTGQLGDPTRAITIRSNAVLSFHQLAATPLNKRVLLGGGATIFGEQGPSFVAGAVTLNGTNQFLVSTNGSPATLTFNGSLGGTGTVWKTGEGTLVLGASNTYNGSTLVSTGTVALTGSGSIAATARIFLNAGSVLDTSSRSDGRLTLATNQVLTGDGMIFGSLTAEAGSVISPGSALGVLTVTNDVVLRGTTLMELNKTAATNDLLQSGASLLYGGTLSVTNVTGAPGLGDQFKLFSAASYGGTFSNIVPSVPGPALRWDTSLLTNNGTLTVSLDGPVITNIAIGGTAVVIGGTNGTPTNSYYVLSSTNLSVPLTNWARLSTNLFDTAGNFIFTNTFTPAVPQQFYLLQVP